MGGRPLRDVTNNYCAEAAGEIIKVCVYGRCKCRVDGTDNIDFGDMLITKAEAKKAILANITTYDGLASVFAKALKAATADGDIIPVFVGIRTGNLT